MKKLLSLSRLSLLIFFCTTIIVQSAAAQPLGGDTAFVAAAMRQVVNQYTDSLGKTLQLYSGPEYIHPSPLTKGHPYFSWDSLQRGTIFYDGVFYPNVLLAYDLVSDAIVVKGFQNLNLTVAPEKISYFTIGAHTFTHITPDSTSPLPAGFYEVLMDDKLTVLAQRKKVVERSLKGDVPIVFAAYNRYYIVTANGVYEVDSERSLLSALEDEKDAVKKFLRRSPLRFKKDKEAVILQTAAYYNNLKS